MKESLNKIRLGFLQGIGIILALTIGLVIVNARSGTDGLTAGPGDKLSATKRNQMLAKINSGGGSSSGINYDSTSNSFQFSGSIIAGDSSTCDSTKKGALKNTSTALQVCDGSSWTDLKSFALGTSSNPATSCYQIAQNTPTAANQVYRIKPDSNPAVQIWCDISGGGRTLVNIIQKTSEHMNPAAVGTITSVGQSTYWKISDSYINSIPKNTGYKLTCGSTSIIFSASCTFGANTPANGACLTAPGSYSTSRGGLSAYDSGGVGAGKIIYGGIGAPANGCLDPTSRAWSNGRLRVK